MGVSSYLMSVWRSSASAEATADRLLLPASFDPSTAAAVAAVAAPMDHLLPTAISPCSSSSQSPSSSMHSLPCLSRSPNKTPCSARHVAFTLPPKLYSWLQDMAVSYNYGSVHKSVRDLLAWACDGQDDDLDWLFSFSDDEVSLRLQVAQIDSFKSSSPCPTASTGKNGSNDEKQVCPHSQLEPSVSLNARVSDNLYDWILHVVDRYSLHGPSAVLETLCKSAIHLEAGEDIFESDESVHDLPISTVELYHDLGILRLASTKAVSR